MQLQHDSLEGAELSKTENFTFELIKKCFKVKKRFVCCFITVVQKQSLNGVFSYIILPIHVFKVETEISEIIIALSLFCIVFNTRTHQEMR